MSSAYRALLMASAALCVVAATPAFAAEASSDVSELVVTGKTFAKAATKTAVPVVEVPQAISVIPAQLYIERGAQTLQDVLLYSSGVRSDAYGNDGRVDSFMVRGSSAAQYLDGLRTTYAFYNTARVDPYALEQVEVLKGPSSVLYGQGAIGGVVNMVTKLPTFMPRGDVGASYGSFDRKQVQADVSGPLAEGLAFRLVALARRSDTQVYSIDDDRTFFAPSVTMRFGDRTELSLLGHFQYDRTGSTTQFLPHQGTLLPNPNGVLPTSTLVSEPDFERYDADQTNATLLFTHRFSDAVQYRLNARASWSDVEYWTMYPNSYTNPVDPWVKAGQPGYTGEKRSIARYISLTEPNNRSLALDNQLQAAFSTGALAHTLLVGLDRQTYHQDLQQSGAVLTTPIDLFAPVYGNYVRPTVRPANGNEQDQTGAYAQDQIKLGALNVILGIRYDNAKTRTITPAGALVASTRDTATTYRAGVLYTFANGLAPYASYSESFLPVAGTNLAGQVFDPQRGKQVEAGIKWQMNPKTLVTAAVYDIRDTNRLTTHPTNPLDRVQTGEVRVKGFEIEGQTSFGRWDLLAAYSYTDADISKSNVAGEVGKPLASVPKHGASGWATYRFDVAGGVARIGGGVRYFGRSIDRNNTATLVLITPSNVLADAVISYERDSWRFAVNARNLFDDVYYSSCLARGDCFIGARRSVIASVGYRF